MRGFPSLAASAVVLLFGVASGADAFEGATHRVLSVSAVLNSGLDAFLKSQFLDFPDGTAHILNGGSDDVLALIADGGVREDSPIYRVIFHFHDPTRTWDQAGLTVGGIQLGESSVLWSQDPTQSLIFGGDYSWVHARDAYLQALKATDQSMRDVEFEQVFRSLGHAIHLVQDAASPAHTRNDPHGGTYLGGTDTFHTWAASTQDDPRGGLADAALSGATFFDASILNVSPNGLAPIPIARIIDAESSLRGVQLWSTSVGIAEYSNAKFFSDDRLFSAYYEPNNVSLRVIDEDVVDGMRRYLYFKDNLGETDYKVATTSALDGYLVDGSSEVALDDFVMSDYGRKLFPRAVGYSAGLINYFTRGTIGIQAPTRYLYGLAEYKANNAGSFTNIKAQITNTSPSGEETSGSGTAWAVVRYRTATDGSDLFVNPGAELDDPPNYRVSKPTAVILGRSATEVTFDFGSDPIPTNSADLSLSVVYQGALGLEANAVLVGTKDLYEPFPMDFGNTTDYDCYKNQLYPLTCRSNSSFPCPYLPADDSRRDVDPQRAGLELIGPVFDSMEFIKTGADGSFISPGPNNFDIEFDTDNYATFGRYILLQDSAVYGVATLIQTQQIITDPNLYSVYESYLVTGLVNDIQTAGDGTTHRRTTANFQYRGWDTFAIVMQITRSIPEWQICGPNSATKKPDITRNDGTLGPQ